MIKVGVIGITAVFFALLLKKEHSDLSWLLGIAASILIFGSVLSKLKVIMDFLQELMNMLPIEPVFLKALLKMLGITYIADFSAAICREAGYSSLAGQMELFAKLSIIALSVPQLLALLQFIEKLISG